MAAKKKETAEQKLLKMMEATTGGGAQAAKKNQKAKNILTLWRTINKVLIVVVIAIALFLFYQISSGVAMLGQVKDFAAGNQKVLSSTGVESLPLTLQRLSFYLVGVNQRNIFIPYEEPKSTNIVEVSDQNTRIARQTENLKLVGISWLDSVDSASVMLEDSQNKVTYFLKKGEKVGDVYVKTIYADSVELGYEDEEIIIKYDQSQTQM